MHRELGLRQQPMQLTHIEQRLLDPPDVNKRRRRGGGIPDLRIFEANQAEKHAHPHDHPHQQRTGRLR
jgi:hypothetical protein